MAFDKEERERANAEAVLRAKREMGRLEDRSTVQKTSKAQRAYYPSSESDSRPFCDISVRGDVSSSSISCLR